MVLGKVLRDSHRTKDIHRSIGRSLFQNAQVKRVSSSSRSLSPLMATNATFSWGYSISLLLGMASFSHYVYSKEDQHSGKSVLLHNVAHRKINEEPTFHLPRSILPKGTTKALCESKSTFSINDRYHPSSLSPTLPYRILQPNPHLEIAFCTRTRNPIYVLEKNVLYTTLDDDVIDPSATSSNIGRSFRLKRNRRPNFFEEKSIPTNMRSRLSDYKHSGWDRGHMAPAADYAPSNHRTMDDQKQQQMEEQLLKEQMQTFNLCNISPQDASLNRGLWSKLESWVRTTIVELQEQEAANNNNENSIVVDDQQRRCQVHVLTGPLWMPTHYSTNKNHEGASTLEYRYLGIGKPPSLVSVPSHFFKVVVVVVNDKTITDGSDRIEKFACFVMANRSTQSDATASETASTSDDDQFLLQDFLVPWSTLETVSGLEFFSHLVDDDFRKRADELTLAQVHRRQRQSQAPRRAPTFQLLEANPNNNGGGRRQRKDLSALEHLCKGGKCRV